MKINQNLEEIKLFLDKANLSNCDEWQIWRYVPNLNLLFLCGYKKKFQVVCFLAFCNVTFLDLPKKLVEPTFVLDLDETLNLANEDSLVLTVYIEGKGIKGRIKSQAVFFVSRDMELKK